MAVLRPDWFQLSVIALCFFHISILVLLGISFVGILPAYVPFIAVLMPQRALSQRSTAIAAAVLGAVAIAALLAPVPDPSSWLFSRLSVPTYLAGVPLLLAIPLVALRGTIRRQRPKLI